MKKSFFRFVKRCAALASLLCGMGQVSHADIVVYSTNINNVTGSFAATKSLNTLGNSDTAKAEIYAFEYHNGYGSYSSSTVNGISIGFGNPPAIGRASATDVFSPGGIKIAATVFLGGPVDNSGNIDSITTSYGGASEMFRVTQDVHFTMEDFASSDVYNYLNLYSSSGSLAYLAGDSGKHTYTGTLHAGQTYYFQKEVVTSSENRFGTPYIYGGGDGFGFVTLAIDPYSIEQIGVPEPSTFALFSLGGIGLAISAYRRHQVYF